MIRLGIPELVMIFMVPSVIYVVWRIVAKTGHSGALSLLILVPLLNIGFLLYLSFSEWPIEKELKLSRGKKGDQKGDQTMLKHAEK